MAYTTTYEGILFVEGYCDFIEFKCKVEYKKDSFFNQQFRNLDDIKHQLAEKAKNVGANAIINFKYGQKTISFFKSILLGTDDNVNWFAFGEAVLVSPEKKQELLEKAKNNV